MISPNAKIGKTKFFILVIDFFDDNESQQFQRSIAQNDRFAVEIERAYHAGTFSALIENLALLFSGFLTKCLSAFPDAVPIIHILGHGSHHGIEIGCTDRSILPWYLLCPMFSIVNQNLQSNLIVCLLSCEGWATIRMSLGVKHATHRVLVAPTGTLRFQELSEAYFVFYSYLQHAESENTVEATILKAADYSINSNIDSEPLLCASSFGAKWSAREIRRLLRLQNIRTVKELVSFIVKERILNRTSQERAMKAFEQMLKELTHKRKG